MLVTCLTFWSHSRGGDRPREGHPAPVATQLVTVQRQDLGKKLWFGERELAATPCCSDSPLAQLWQRLAQVPHPHLSVPTARSRMSAVTSCTWTFGTGPESRRAGEWAPLVWEEVGASNLGWERQASHALLQGPR